MSRTATNGTNRMKSSSGGNGSNEKKDKKIVNGTQQKMTKKVESSSSDDDDDDEPIRAPIQLKIEFVNSIMFRQWELAKKLCSFMLLYEPDNNEAKQFAPLIDYMVTKEESSSSDDEDDDDDTDDDDDDDDSSQSSSSSSDNDEEEQQQQPSDINDAKAPKPVNASLSHKCQYHK